MATFSDLFASLDPDPRVRGKQFEHVCKWFLTNDPMYKSALRRVWLWSEWTGRWGGDAGIDLVAEDHDGRLWAIQAKAYDPANAVTKADVDKFLAESSRAVFSYRLLIATTDKLHHVARRTINDQEKQVAFVGLSDLLTSEVNWHTNPLDMRPSPPPKPAKPREHQREAIRDVVKGFTKSDRGQLIMACGTGKTLTSLFIKEKLDAERVLVLVPSLSLLKQTMQVWRVNARVPFEALPVCSDETVGRSEDDAAVATPASWVCPSPPIPPTSPAFLRRRSGPRVRVLDLPVLPADRRGVRPRTGARVRPGDRRRGAPLSRVRIIRFRHGSRPVGDQSQTAAVHDRDTALLHRSGPKGGAGSRP